LHTPGQPIGFTRPSAGLFNPSVTLGTDPASFHFGKGGLTSRAKNNKGNELQHANASMKNAYKSASIT
ncbi:MAG: hypothetical protein ACI4QF_00610, partial [Kiritimatiellia bacterium]